jgi:hypothetical protein
MGAGIDHIAVVERPRWAVGEIVDIDLATQPPMRNFCARSRGQKQIHGAALVGLQVAERDPAQLVDWPYWLMASETIGNSRRGPVWNISGSSPSTRNWLNIKSASGMYTETR